MLALIFALMMQGTVQKILVPSIAIYDEHGQPTGKQIDRKQIAVPTAIEATSKGLVAIRVGGQLVYVRKAEVQYSGSSICVPSAEQPGSPRRQGAAIPVGVQSGLGSGDKPCVTQ